MLQKISNDTWNCMCTVGLFLAMYSRTEESLMGNAHEFSTAACAGGAVLLGRITQPASAHGNPSRPPGLLPRPRPPCPS